MVAAHREAQSIAKEEFWIFFENLVFQRSSVRKNKKKHNTLAI